MLPAFSTIIWILRGISEQEAKATLNRGQDPSVVGIIRLGNVQNYLRPRDFRIGRENKMNIGIVATFTEIEGVDGSALDPDDRMRRIADGDRGNLTVDRLCRMIDEEHLERESRYTSMVHYASAICSISITSTFTGDNIISDASHQIVSPGQCHQSPSTGH